MKIPREVTDALFALCFYALLAGGARFFVGTIEGVALWRIVFFCSVVAWVHGYVTGGRPEGQVVGSRLDGPPWSYSTGKSEDPIADELHGTRPR